MAELITVRAWLLHEARQRQLVSEEERAERSNGEGRIRRALARFKQHRRHLKLRSVATMPVLSFQKVDVAPSVASVAGFTSPVVSPCALQPLLRSASQPSPKPQCLRGNGNISDDYDDDDVMTRRSTRHTAQQLSPSQRMVARLRERIAELQEEQEAVAQRQRRRHDVQVLADGFAAKRALAVVRATERNARVSDCDRVAMQSNVLHEEVVSQAQAALFREQKRHQAQGRSLARLEGAF
jgi:TolA-binding protein